MLVALLALAALLASMPGAEAKDRRTARLPVGQLSYTVLDGPSTTAETIVMVHGLGSGQKTFSEMAARLAQKYRVITLDQRGHGDSAARGRDYSTDVLARDLKGLLDHLAVGPVHLVGHSMGGRTVVRFAAMFPARVRSVVVEDMEMIQRRALSADDRAAIEREARSLRRRFARSFASADEATDQLTPFFGGDRAWARETATRRSRTDADGRLRLTFRPDVHTLYRAQANAEDLGPALAEVRAPVLFLRSGDREPDASMSKAGRTHIRRVRPGTRIERVAGSGHSIHWTHPDEFFAAVDGFVGASRPPAHVARPTTPRRPAATRARTGGRRVSAGR